MPPQLPLDAGRDLGVVRAKMQSSYFRRSTSGRLQMSGEIIWPALSCLQINICLNSLVLSSRAVCGTCDKETGSWEVRPNLLSQQILVA